ncbi:hypothetical protein DFH06DRAFT_1319331 [Mycena polygramma]|nr:hypothetical protein DFH06DRAFT_1319331 [Mycena polygramma]
MALMALSLALRVSSSSPPHWLRAELESVNLEILRHQTYISELKAKQGTLELKLSRILYPVLSLPTNIIAHIFVECLPVHGRVRPSATAPPLLLAQICRDWREIALHTCQLWRSVDVQFIQRWDNSELPNGGALPIMNTWLSRNPDAIIPLIFSVASQVHTLELTLSKNDFDILAQNMVAFPGLRQLALSPRLGYYYANEYLGDEGLSILDRAPLLVNLRIKAAPPSISLLSPSLTSLKIRQQIVLSTLFHIFQQCPHLLHLTVDVDRQNREDRLPITTLAHLQSLVISGSGVDLLDLPALRYLDVHHTYAVYEFIKRSRCTLEHLGIGIDYYDRESKLLEILKAVPSLTSLTIDVHSHMDFFAEVLEKNPALLSQLTTLRISAEHSTFNHLPFIQLLRERRAPFPGRIRLAFVRLDLRSKDELSEGWWLSRAAIIEFDKLVAQGLEVQVTCVDDYDRPYAWPKGSNVPAPLHAPQLRIGTVSSHTQTEYAACSCPAFHDAIACHPSASSRAGDFVGAPLLRAFHTKLSARSRTPHRPHLPRLCTPARRLRSHYDAAVTTDSMRACTISPHTPRHDPAARSPPQRRRTATASSPASTRLRFSDSVILEAIPAMHDTPRNAARGRDASYTSGAPALIGARPASRYSAIALPLL